ncbi:hypothetical protein OCAR_7400 [Afipia carboxidovorans OM5]|nr:hypothetical protein OCAR_7400 [Afipia carboxidovorans OM5]
MRVFPDGASGTFRSHPAFVQHTAPLRLEHFKKRRAYRR